MSSACPASSILVRVGAVSLVVCAATSALAQGDVPPGTGGPGAVDPISAMPSFGAALVRMLVSLGVVLAIGLLALWLIRRRGGSPWKRRGGGSLHVVESCPLAPGHALHLVRVGDQFVLVGSSPAGLRAVSEVLLDNEALLQEHSRVPATESASAERVSVTTPSQGAH